MVEREFKVAVTECNYEYNREPVAIGYGHRYVYTTGNASTEIKILGNGVEGTLKFYSGISPYEAGDWVKTGKYIDLVLRFDESQRTRVQRAKDLNAKGKTSEALKEALAVLDEVVK
jgi:hypothetical protein